MNCVSHITHGLWRLPDNNRERFNDIEYWTELAKLLESGGFDAVFLADVVGTYDTFRGSADTAIRQGLQIPNNDPSVVVPAMAAVTKHLGFGITFSTTYEPPFAWARRASTLDHLTKGRVGWNIVTSYLPNAARNHGLEGEVEHDNRFERADEYLDVLYKLWEGSWDDDAITADHENNVFADPAKIRPIFHDGTYFKVEGPHLPSPSRQRTPVLFTATQSAAGTAFAGKHAEVVFTGGPSEEFVKRTAASLKQAAVDAGRAPGDLKVITTAGVIVAPTEEEARAKLARFQELSDPEGYLAHAGLPWDPTAYPADLPVDQVPDLAEGRVGRFRQVEPGQTVGDFLAGFGDLAPAPAVRRRYAGPGGRRDRALARRRRHRRHQPPPVPLLRHGEGLHRARRAGAARARPAACVVRRGRVPARPDLRRGRPPPRTAPRRPLPRRRPPPRLTSRTQRRTQRHPAPGRAAAQRLTPRKRRNSP